MRKTWAIVLLLGAAMMSAAQPSVGSGQAARPARTKPDGDLAQLMRGMLFPNSNLLFDVQEHDPGAPKPATGTGPGASAAYANVYTGWEVVEGAAVSIAESVDLMLKPGRLCSNGKPAPVTDSEFVRYAEALRVAGRKALEGARAKSQSQVSDSTNDLAEACSNCHEKYRDKGPVGSPARCTP